MSFLLIARQCFTASTLDLRLYDAIRPDVSDACETKVMRVVLAVLGRAPNMGRMWMGSTVGIEAFGSPWVCHFSGMWRNEAEEEEEGCSGFMVWNVRSTELGGESGKEEGVKEWCEKGRKKIGSVKTSTARPQTTKQKKRDK